MKINLKLNHVYMMVGPSCCGKSYLSKKIKEHCIKKYKKDYVKIISSDEWRRFTLRQDFHKHDPRMLAASSAAFSYLEHDLITSLKYPQSLYNKIIIVDTTGLNKEFRTKIDFIAKNHQYGVGVILFNFDNKEDYYTYLTEKEDKNVISFQIKKFKKSLGDLTLSRNKQDVIKINKRERNIISLLGIESHLKSELDSSLNYEIVSDIHCRLDLLKKVLIKKDKSDNSIIELDDNGNIIHNPNNKLIINGDWIDKNTDQLLDIINWIYFNRESIYLTLGNHENYNYKVLQGIHKPELPKNLDKKELRDKKPNELTSNEIQYLYFDSYPILKENPKEQDRFIELVEKYSRPFYLCPHKFIVHHSSTNVKYIGKLDKQSVNHQIKERYLFSKQNESIEDYTYRLKESLQESYDLFNSTFIINGHIKSQNIYKVPRSNKLLIDIGAEDGYGLASVRFYKDNYYPYQVIHIEDESKKDNLINFNIKDKKEFDKEELQKVETFLKYNPVNFLQPTISPAKSNLKENSLESLTEAFDYYKNKGIQKVVMQLKLMGSNCFLYLFKNREQCYATSRQGFIINKIDLNPLLDEWHKKVFTKFPEEEFILLIGELEPWSVMDYNSKGEYGKGDWINNTFYSTLEIEKTKLNFLKEKNFYKEYEKVLNLENTNSHFKKVKSLAENFNKYIIDPKDLENNIQIYEKELKAYSYYGKPFFTPFNILKMGEKVLPFNNKEGWDLFNKKGCILFDINEYKEALNISNNWANNCKELFNVNAIEGVMIKPLESNLKDVLPAIKVRTDNYLSLVYGINYKNNLVENIKQKNCNRKRSISLEQWQVALKMLNTPFEQVCFNKSHIYNTAYFKANETKLEKVDPRL